MIELSVNGPVGRLLLNHPERHNALTRRGLQQMHAHLDRLEQAAELRVLVVSGSGDRTFCAGAALEDLRDGTVDGESFQAMVERLARLPVPKLAAMNGSAYGGGAELGLCCDFRVGVTGMKVRVPAATFGLCYPPAGIRRFVSRLGVDAAKRILVAAETLESAELLRIGYLHRVCGAQELAAVVDGWSRELCELAPLAVRAMLTLCNSAADNRLDSEEARQWADRCAGSADLREGLAAALEKRRPVFRGS